MASFVAPVVQGLQIAQSLTRRPFLTTIFKVDAPDVAITFDATVSSTHSGDAEITDHPVEEGSDITDHIRRNPERLELNASVTDTPVKLLPALRAGPAVSGGSLNKRSKEAWDALVQLKDEGALVNVATKLRDYENMAITNLAVTQDKDTSNVINARISLRQIIIATTESQPVTEPINQSRKRKQNLGKKTKTPADGVSAEVQALLDEVSATLAF